MLYSSTPTAVSHGHWRHHSIIGLMLVWPCSIAAAQSLEIPLGGNYGTVAVCILDAITDAPLPVTSFNFGGAPMIRVTPEGMETAADSCLFKRLVAEAGAGQGPASDHSWAVAAKCSSDEGDRMHTVSIHRLDNESLSIRDADNRILATADNCRLPYAERAQREVTRMSQARESTK